MLVQLIYASVAADASDATINAILAQGRRDNQDHGISGVLCTGYGVYIQAIEGERALVNRIYAQVLRDVRHSNAQLLHFAEITERAFSNWELGHVKLEKLSASFVLKYAAQLPLSPDQFRGDSALAMMKDLVATASVAHR